MSSGSLRRCLPFSAVKEMERVKKALQCAVVDDGILGVLIKGPTGTAKSVIVRSFVNMLPGKNIISIPQNVTDEQLFGGLDIEDAIRFGKATVKGGTLRKADLNILYLDNINLFDQRTVNSVLEHAGSKKVTVEREGVSSEYDLRTTVMATMDPAEQALPDSITDRFDICVQSYPVKDEAERNDLISVNLAFDADPDGLTESYSAEDEKTLNRIENARKILNNVTMTSSDLEKISQVCMDLNVKGHRADISVARVSKTLAALDGRSAVEDGDIKEAAIMCLLHRRRDAPGVIGTDEPEDTREAAESEPTEKRTAQEFIDNMTNPEPAADVPCGAGTTGTVSDIISSVTEFLDVMDQVESVRLHRIAGAGRRKNIIVRKKTGRYRRSKIPESLMTDLAFDATVRAAAPYQRTRENKGLSVSIEKRDIREKVRMKRDSCSFLFAVDVSGSLVESGMLYDIKNGVKAMLADGYVQRDKVALMTFRTRDVKISVPFTRSVECICDVLDNTEAGGGTPLGEALLMIRDYLLNYIRKNPEERCFVILVTDGEATNTVTGGEPFWELKKMAPFMKIKNTEWAVVDSKRYAERINYAKRLADLLEGRYIRLEDIQYV